MASAQLYSIPVVYQQNSVETLKQMLDVLHHLEQVSSNVMQRIQNRAQQQQQRLQGIQQRTQSCKTRVQTVKERKQATTVFSSSQYPTETSERHKQKKSNQTGASLKILEKEFFTHEADVEPLFGNAKENVESFRLDQGILPPKFHKIPLSINSMKNYKLTNPVSYYQEHANLSSVVKKHIMSTKLKAKEAEKKVRGIGSIPKQNSTVSSLLLYNSDDYLYSQYNMEADPLNLLSSSSEAAKRDTEELIDLQNGLEAPPPSLLSDNVLETGDFLSSVVFKPKMRELDNFQLPSALDLPNVIDNPFDLDLDRVVTTIAPSSGFLQLPSIIDNDNGFDTARSVATPSTNPSSVTSPVAHVDVSNGSVPPPPPPMMSSIPAPTVSDFSVGAPPPPPPPPPMPAPKIAVASTESAPSIPAVPALNLPAPADEDDGGNDGGGGSDLLKSIRNFSLKTLRKTKSEDEEAEASPKKKPPKVSSGGDFMSDLLSKISMRRNAIAGDTSKKSKKPKDEDEEDWE